MSVSRKAFNKYNFFKIIKFCRNVAALQSADLGSSFWSTLTKDLKIQFSCLVLSNKSRLKNETLNRIHSATLSNHSGIVEVKKRQINAQ